MSERDRTERDGNDRSFEDADPTEWLGTTRPDPQQSWHEDPTEHVQRRKPRSRPWSRLKRSRPDDASDDAAEETDQAAGGAGVGGAAASAGDPDEDTQLNLGALFDAGDSSGADEEPTTYLDPSARSAGSTLLQPAVDPGEYEQRYEPTKYQQPAAFEPARYEQQPRYEQPKYEQPKYEEPQYESARYEQPDYGQAQQGAAARDQAFGESESYAQGAFGQHDQAQPPVQESTGSIWPEPAASAAPPDLAAPVPEALVSAEESDAAAATALVPRLAAGGDPSSRSEILGRIRAAVGGRPAPTWEMRGYRRSLDLRHDELVALFSERVRDYKAEVRRISADQLPAEIAVRLVERGIRRVIVPADAPPSWLPQYVDVQIDDGALTAVDIDGIDGVITGSAVAVAETGTIVLDGGRLQGRRMLSLVPDYHLCVVEASDVVGNLPEALARLDPTRPLTFISGPSATSDIELDRVEGVHGPRTLDVLLID